MDASNPAPADSLLKLLVVDDEPQLLASLKRALRGQYAVVTATDAKAALATLQGSDAEFHAVLCDIHMPGMSGPEFRQELQKRCPSLARHFIWMTGDFTFATTPMCEERILRKPFAPQDIDAAILQVTRAAETPKRKRRAPYVVEGSIQDHPHFGEFMRAARDESAVILRLCLPLDASTPLESVVDAAMGELRGQAFRAQADVLKPTLFGAWRWADARRLRRVLHVLGVGKKWAKARN